jgi:hypothetical protein
MGGRIAAAPSLDGFAGSGKGQVRGSRRQVQDAVRYQIREFLDMIEEYGLKLEE